MRGRAQAFRRPRKREWKAPARARRPRHPPLTCRGPGAMFAPMTITVARICRYPVKGLTAETLDRVELAVGRALPWDRHFAIVPGSTPVGGATIGWMPKTSFLSLLKH